jgi:hypothetical protein
MQKKIKMIKESPRMVSLRTHKTGGIKAHETVQEINKTIKKAFNLGKKSGFLWVRIPLEHANTLLI